MPNTIDPARRIAPLPEEIPAGPVTLINSFSVPAGRDDAFRALWTEASLYFRAQPGFVALKLHRAVSPEAAWRFVNVAMWGSAAHFAAAHGTPEFRRLVSQPGWSEFPSSPALYEVATEQGPLAAA